MSPMSNVMMPADFTDTQEPTRLNPLVEILKIQKLMLWRYCTGEDMSDALMMTLTASRDINGNRRMKPTDANLQNEVPDHNWIQDRSAWPNNYCQAAALVCSYRRHFHTVHGYMGLGPGAMQPGDIVCVLFGAGVPYILRPQDNYYRLVGESYVHGLMDGEALELLKEKQLSKAEFELR
jgi:hypothetical protein